MPVIDGLPIPNHANMPKPRPDKTEKRITDGAGCIRFSPKYDQAILGSQKFQSQYLPPRPKDQGNEIDILAPLLAPIATETSGFLGRLDRTLEKI